MKRIIGATGIFPRGKLNKEDEGELNLAFSIENGNVRVDFGKRIAWMAMPPEIAIQFASQLTKRAIEIRKVNNND